MAKEGKIGEKTPDVKVGDLVTCTECQGVGWVGRLEALPYQPDHNPYAAWTITTATRPQRTGPPVICPLCQGARKVQVMAS